MITFKEFLIEAKLYRPDTKVRIPDEWKNTRHGKFWMVRLQSQETDNFEEFLVHAPTEEQALAIGMESGGDYLIPREEDSFASTLDEYFDDNMFDEEEIEGFFDEADHPPAPGTAVYWNSGS